MCTQKVSDIWRAIKGGVWRRRRPRRRCRRPDWLTTWLNGAAACGAQCVLEFLDAEDDEGDDDDDEILFLNLLFLIYFFSLFSSLSIMMAGKMGLIKLLNLLTESLTFGLWGGKGWSCVKLWNWWLCWLLGSTERKWDWNSQLGVLHPSIGHQDIVGRGGERDLNFSLKKYLWNYCVHPGSSSCCGGRVIFKG